MQTVSPSDRLVTDHLPYTAAVTNDLLNRCNLRKAIRPDDAVAYARIGLIEAAARFRPETGASFATFSYSRIRGAVMDGVRKNRTASRVFVERRNGDDPEDSYGRIPFETVDPNDLVEAASLRSALLPAINALSEVERHVVLLYHFEGLTFERIARRLGLTKSYVSRVHQKALPELARRLHKVGVEYGFVKDGAR